MCAVIGVFMMLAVRYLFHLQGWAGVFSIQALLRPQDFQHSSDLDRNFLRRTHLYRFRRVTTLAEDVENPKRNVMLATVSVCLFTGIVGGLGEFISDNACGRISGSSITWRQLSWT
jgi:putrescine importer